MEVRLIGTRYATGIIMVYLLISLIFLILFTQLILHPLFLAFFIGCILFCFYRGVKDLKYYYLITGIPTSKVRSLAIGLSEVKGIIHPFTQKLISPFSKQECVLYKYIVEEYRRSHRSSYWVPVKVELKSVPFYLVDDTGRVLVDPRGAELDLDPSYRATSPFTYEIEDFLRSIGVSTTFLFFPKKLRVTEYCIPINSELYVLGYVGDNPYIEEATTVLGHEDLMVQKMEKEPFYLSTKSEKDLVKKLKRRAILTLSMGTAALSGLLYAVLIFFI